MPVTDPAELRRILEETKRVAVVGLSADEMRPSYGVAEYLQRRAGYQIVPVNPKWVGQTILGEPVYATLMDVPGPIDVVDVFRRAVDMPRVVRDAIAVKASVLWMQQGIVNEEAAAEAEAAGITVVMDNCMATTHRLLVPRR